MKDSMIVSCLIGRGGGGEDGEGVGKRVDRAIHRNLASGCMAPLQG